MSETNIKKTFADIPYAVPFELKCVFALSKNWVTLVLNNAEKRHQLKCVSQKLILIKLSFKSTVYFVPALRVQSFSVSQVC